MTESLALLQENTGKTLETIGTAKLSEQDLNTKNQQMQLNQTAKLLHSKGNNNMIKSVE